MPDPIARTYLSLGAFYASDPARRTSRERDVGLFWRSRQGPTYRAAWVHDTGELYLFQHALGGPGGGTVHLISRDHGRARAGAAARRLARRLRPRGLARVAARADAGRPPRTRAHAPPPAGSAAGAIRLGGPAGGAGARSTA